MERLVQSRTQETASRITEFVLSNYDLLVQPRVLMWRELINEYTTSHNEFAETWRQDCKQSHDHWLKYGKIVSRSLQANGITTIPVGATIRQFLKHGDRPLRDDRRDDDFYRRSIPGPHSPTRGIVCFPRDTFQDHPLIIAKLKGRCTSAASGVRNAIEAVEVAEERGVLSSESRQGIAERVVPDLAPALVNAQRMKHIESKE